MATNAFSITPPERKIECVQARNTGTDLGLLLTFCAMLGTVLAWPAQMYPTNRSLQVSVST